MYSNHLGFAAAITLLLALGAPIGEAQASDNDGDDAVEAPSHLRLGGARPTGPNLDVGFELAELGQNKFRNLGPENYTILVGQRFWMPNLEWLGWRVLSIGVDLSNEHLRDEATVCCIDGNRENLVGELDVHRLYADFYPGSLDLGYIEALGQYALSFQPVFSLGAGYSRWATTDTAAGETHDVAGLTLGGAARLRTELLGWFFVELPVIDAFFLTATNRSPSGQVGEAYLDRPEHFGVFGWLNAGVHAQW